MMKNGKIGMQKSQWMRIKQTQRWIAEPMNQARALRVAAMNRAYDMNKETEEISHI